jgi:hypothetical protein
MKNDTWKKLSQDLGLKAIDLSHSGLTEKGQLNVMNNIHSYLPIDHAHSRDAVSVLMEMVWSTRSYERRNGHDGKYIQPWLATKLDAVPPEPALPEAPAPAAVDWAELGPRLAEALKGAQRALRKALPHCPADEEHNGDSVFVGEWLDEVNEVVAILPA